MLKNFITRRLVSVAPGTKITDVARLMSENDVGAVLVQDQGAPVGIVTDRDIVLHCLKNGQFEDEGVDRFLKRTEKLATVRDTDGVYDCIRKMRESKVRRIPVIDDSGKAVAIISFGDLLLLLSRELGELAEVASPEVPAKKSIAA